MVFICIFYFKDYVDMACIFISYFNANVDVVLLVFVIVDDKC